MRGAFLDQYISENAKFLGFWEHISSLGFKTIGSRMTSLSLEQVDSLLEKLKLPAKQHGIMVNIYLSNKNLLMVIMEFHVSEKEVNCLSILLINQLID